MLSIIFILLFGPLKLWAQPLPQANLDNFFRCSKEEWIRDDSRTQAGEWYWFPGKGVGRDLKSAYLFAEGLALKRLQQECQGIPANVKFNERCDDVNDKTHYAYVRAAVKQNDCERMAKFNEKVRKEKSNSILVQQLDSYKAKIDEIQKQHLNKAGQNPHYTLEEVSINKGEGHLALKGLEKSCEKKNSIACYEAGSIYESHGKITEAAKFYKIACIDYNVDACAAEADIYHNQDNRQEAKPLYQKACYNDHGPACLRLGLYNEDEVNDTLAAKLFQKACKLDEMRGCTSLGLLYMKQGKAGQAKEQFEKACKKSDDKTPCILVGQAKADMGDINGAKETFNENCNLGYGGSCSDLGTIEFRAGHIDLAKNYYRKGCYLKDGLSCFNLGVIESKASRIKESKELYQSACDHNFFQGCLQLGELMISENKIEARKLFEKACMGNVEIGCFKFGLMKLIDGTETDKKKVYQQGCTDSYWEGCELLAELEVKEGKKEEARHHFDIACEKNGSSSGCYKLAGYYAREQDTENGLKYLEKSLSIGFKEFAHIEGLKHLSAYKEILKKYKVP